MQYPLSGERFLLIEQGTPKMRLVITNGKEELACRKETKTKLLKFLSTDRSQLFKGRLQLHKKDDNLLVYLHGGPVGVVDIREFKKTLV